MATPITDTELKEVLNALQKLTEGVAAISQRMEVGFAQMDTKLADLRGEMNQKFAQMDTKLSETKAELKSKIQKVEAKVDVIDERTKIGFWGFVGRAVIVSLLGFLILMAVKYALTGTIKLV
jgi:hypothetical protein